MDDKPDRISKDLGCRMANATFVEFLSEMSTEAMILQRKCPAQAMVACSWQQKRTTLRLCRWGGINSRPMAALKMPSTNTPM